MEPSKSRQAEPGVFTGEPPSWYTRDMTENPQLVSLLLLLRGGAAIGSAISLWVCAASMLVGGGMDGITVGLAVLALLIGPASFALGWRSVSRFGWSGILGGLVLGCTGVTWSVGNVDSVRGLAVGMDYQLGGALGIATVFDLLDETRGPELLSQPIVAESLHSELQPVSTASPADIALWFAAMRLQGHESESILAKEDTLVWLGLLAAEASPPWWWAEAPWIAETLNAQPADSFQLGLIDPQDASRRTATAWDNADHGNLQRVGAFRGAAQAHVGILDRDRLDQVSEAWFAFFPEMAWALEPSRMGREQLGALLAREGVGQEVGARLLLPPDLEKELRRAALFTIEAMLASLGYRRVEGDEIVVDLEMETRAFPRVSMARHKVNERVVQGGMYFDLVYFYQMMPEADRVERTVDNRVFQGEVVAPVASMRVRVGESELVLESRPFGLVPLEEGADPGGSTWDLTNEIERKEVSLSRVVFGSWNNW